MCTRLYFGTIFAACAVAYPLSADADSVPDPVASDFQTDQKLDALHPPALQAVPYPDLAEEGAPLSPLYKEEPAKGQTDFRPAPPVEEKKDNPSPKPKPKPDPTPPPPPPPPPPPCTPNSPDWPNCLQQP